MPDLSDKSTDVSVHGNGVGNPAIEAIADGSIHRLAVDAKISSGVVTAGNIGTFVGLGYVYSVALSVNMASAGVRNPLILIKNPSGSGKTLYLYKINFGVDVENNYANFVLFANPTITANGTGQTPLNRNIGGGFGASSIEAFSLPTIAANGSQVLNVEIGQNNNSIESLTDFSVLVKPNNNILITGDPKSNNRAAVLTVVWAEF